MRFTGCQIFRVGEGGAAGQTVVGERGLGAAGQFLGPGPQEQGAGWIGRSFHGSVQTGDGGGGVTVQKLSASPVGQRLGAIGTRSKTGGEGSCGILRAAPDFDGLAQLAGGFPVLASLKRALACSPLRPTEL